jgi:hypothetical protein
MSGDLNLEMGLHATRNGQPKKEGTGQRKGQKALANLKKATGMQDTRGKMKARLQRQTMTDASVPRSAALKAKY